MQWCFSCSKAVKGGIDVFTTCKYCKQVMCVKHRMPESHDCKIRDSSVYSQEVEALASRLMHDASACKKNV